MREGNGVNKNNPGAPRAVLLAILSIIVSSLSGCVSQQPVERKYETIRAEVEPGDRIRVRLHSGEELNFRVTELRETEIVGDTSTDITRGEIVTVPLIDIQELARIDREYGKELLLIGGAVASAAVLFVLAAVVVFATF